MDELLLCSELRGDTSTLMGWKQQGMTGTSLQLSRVWHCPDSLKPTGFGDLFIPVVCSSEAFKHFHPKCVLQSS